MPPTRLHLIPDFHARGNSRRLLEMLASDPTARGDTVVAWHNAGPWRGRFESLAGRVLDLGSRPRDVLRPFRWRGLLQSNRPKSIRFWTTERRLPPWIASNALPAAEQSVVVSRAEELPDRTFTSALAWERAWNEVYFTNPSWLPEGLCGGQDYQLWKLDFNVLESNNSTTRASLRAELDIPLDARLALTVGPLTIDKRIEDLIWGVDQVACVRDDFHLLIVGQGPDRARLERYADCYHVPHRVHFLDYRDDLPAIFRAVDFYATADRTQRVSMALAEARASDLPIVACDTPATRYVLQDASPARYVNSQYVAEYSTAFLRTLESLDAASV